MPLGRLRGFAPEKMAELRAARQLSIDSVAVSCGVSSGAVRSWEAGRFTPSPAAAKRLADALGVPMYQLTTIDPGEATVTDLRQWQGWSGDDAAERSGVGKASIYGSERYVSPLPEHVRQHLAAAYGVTPKDLDAAWWRGRQERFPQEGTP